MRTYASLYNIADGNSYVIFQDSGSDGWDVYIEVGGPGSRPEAERIARALNNEM